MKHTRKTTLFCTTALLGAFTMAQAAPTVLTTELGRGADLNVRGGAFATGNHGTNLLRVRNATNLQDARKLYLRFDLASLPATIKKATSATMGLRILPAEGNSAAAKVWTFKVSGLKDGLPEENWNEKSVTWNNAPASDVASGLDLTQDAVSLGTFTIAGKGVDGQEVTFSSPNLLKFLQSDSNGVVTLIITRQELQTGAGDDVTHNFASKESNPTTPPVLSIAFNGEDSALAIGKPVVMPPAPISFPTEPLPANANAASEINAFWEADKKQMPPQNAVLFMGSSSIRLWTTLAEDFPELPVINRGFGGSLLQESTQYADRIALPYHPKIIVLFAGTNDMAYGNKSAQQVAQDFQNFEAKIHASLPETRIIYVSINPTVARWNQETQVMEANYLIAKFVFENNSPTHKLNFINSHDQLLNAEGQPQPNLLREDGLHLNADGYKIWTSIIRARLLPLAAIDGVITKPNP